MNFIVMVFASLLMVSCAGPFGLNLKDYHNNTDILLTAWEKTAQFKYIPDIIDYWKSPIEFESDGGGDCEDFAVYLMYLLGDESEFVGFMREDGLHAIVRYKGLLIEPQIFMTTLSDVEIARVYSYREVMQRATFWGMKGI